MNQQMRWWRRRGPLAGAVAFVLVVLVGGALLLVQRHSDQDRLAVGDTRSGDFSFSGPYFGSFRFSLPDATVTVSAATGDRGSRLDDSTHELVRVKAPEDGELVKLDWSVVPSGAATHVGNHPSSLAVRSKGTSVVVDPAIKPAPNGSDTSSDSDDDSKIVAVPGDASDVQLTLTYQGRTQSISLVDGRRRMGAFAPYYRSPFTTGVVSFATNQPSDSRSPFRWSADAVLGGVRRTAYLDGLGWAAAGHEWVVVSGTGWRARDDIARWSDRDHLAYYAMHGTPRTSVTVNGVRAVKPLGRAKTTSEHSVRSSTRDYAVQIRAGDAVSIRLSVVMPAERQAGEYTSAPERTTLRLSNNATYPAVPDPRVRGAR